MKLRRFFSVWFLSELLYSRRRKLGTDENFLLEASECVKERTLLL